MNRFHAGVALVLGLAVSGVASAKGSGAFTGRVGVSGGSYNFEDKFIDQGCCGFPTGTEFPDQEGMNQYGLMLGTGVTISRFFADVGIEYLKYSEDQDTDFDGNEDTPFYRSDFLLTLGAFIGDHWTAFAGYRHATFGDGFFSEDPVGSGNAEDGPFLGGGFSFRAGRAVGLGASAAYNFLTLSSDGTVIDEVDLDGISVKLQMSFLGTPHSVFLRWQRFDGDRSEAGSFDYEYTEDYLNVGYQATFDFATW